MKSLFAMFFFLFLPYTVFASGEDAVETYLDYMLDYSVKSDEEKNKLPDVISDIENLVKNDEENSYLWYLKGRSSIAALRLYKSDDEKYKKFRNLISKEYEMALYLNKNKNVLTVDQLYKLYTKALYYPISEEAAKQYLALKESQGKLYKKEHLRVLRERIIPLLIKQNKFDEAYEEIAFIDEHFPENTQGETGNIAWRQHFEQEIAQQKSKLAQAEKPEEKLAQTPEPQKPTAAQAPAEQPPAVKAEPVPQQPDIEQATDNNGLIIIGLVLAMVVLAGFMLARRRKK